MADEMFVMSEGLQKLREEVIFNMAKKLLTHNQRSAIAKKSWETRKRNAKKTLSARKKTTKKKSGKVA